MEFRRVLFRSQANVRRVKAGISVEDLAEDIARRTLLQSLSVRPVRDAEGVATGIYEVPAGGRRFRALELLVKKVGRASGREGGCQCGYISVVAGLFKNKNDEMRKE